MKTTTKKGWRRGDRAAVRLSGERVVAEVMAVRGTEAEVVVYDGPTRRYVNVPVARLSLPALYLED